VPPIEPNLPELQPPPVEPYAPETHGSIVQARFHDRFTASAVEIWFGFALAVATLFTVGLVSYQSTWEFAKTTRWVTHTHRVIEVLRDLQTAATKAENQSWAYILADNPICLIDRRRSLDRLEADLAELKPLISDNPQQVKNLDTLAPMLRRQIALSDAAIAEAHRHGQAAAGGYVLTHGWTKLGNEIDRRVGAMTAVEDGLLKHRQLREQRIAGLAIRIIAYGSLAALLFVSFAAVFIQRVLGRLRIATEMAEMEAHHAEQRGRELARQTETARRAEARFRNLIESATDAILTVSPGGRITYANARAAQYFGYPLAELVGANVDMLVPEAKRAAHAGQIAAYAGAPRVRAKAPNLDLRARRRDGSEFPVEISLSPIEDDGGPQVLTTIRDMTEYRAAQAYRSRLSALVEASSYAIVSHSPDGIALSWNRGAERLYGWAADEIVGRNVGVLVPDYKRAEYQDGIARIVAGAGLQEFETQRRRKDGTIVDIAVAKSPIFDDRGRLVAISSISYDITERKRAAANLLARTAELARSNAELEQFAYVASHDLQEPLRMVASYLQLIAQRYAGRLDSDADDFINFAVDGATRMKQLINDLLNYSRAGSGAGPAPVDLDATLHRALGGLALRIEEAHANVTSDPLPRVLGDDNGLYHNFLNLIGNAIKFHGAEPPRIHIGARREGDQWIISVADNGIGIAAEYYERIFAMFQRLHGREEYPGTGIGLAICKRIIERLGGRIWVESQLGQGATFCFTLDACEVSDESNFGADRRTSEHPAG